MHLNPVVEFAIFLLQATRHTCIIPMTEWCKLLLNPKMMWWTVRKNGMDGIDGNWLLQKLVFINISAFELDFFPLHIFSSNSMIIRRRFFAQ